MIKPVTELVLKMLYYNVYKQMAFFYENYKNIAIHVECRLNNNVLYMKL